MVERKGEVQLPLYEQVRRAVDSLKRVGIVCKVWVDSGKGQNTGYIVVDLNSLANIVKDKITYPNKTVKIFENYLIIEVW